MARRLFSIASVFSLLLCVATASLWIRSHWKSDDVWQFLPRRYFACASFSGTLLFFYEPEDYPAYPVGWAYTNEPTMRFPNRDVTPDGTYHRFAWLGFGYDPDYSIMTFRGGHTGYRLYLPHWLFCLIFLIMPVTWFRRRWRDRWLKREGHCRVCGYDLRASEGRCPECRTAIVPSVVSASRTVS
jgi:hypothetical protein